jgi:hypothetical protein
MNDLTYGATLLSCFVILVVTVIIEATSAPERTGATATRAAPVTANGDKTTAKDCASVALAPAATSH